MLNFIRIFVKGLPMRFIHLTDLHASNPDKKNYFPNVLSVYFLGRNDVSFSTVINFRGFD